MDTTERTLRRTDYLWLTLLCALLYGIAVIDGRGLTTHEATHCQNVREMFANGEYLIPTYGGRPWLERPPVPHWLTGMVACAVADPSQPWAMRLGSGVMGTVLVLVWAWATASAFGRPLGLLSAIVLATMREFAAYATGPEADIFLASFVTIAGAMYLRTEYGPAITTKSPSFFGGRPWTVWAFFAILGSTNAMKGPLFGTAFLGSSFVVYLLIGRDWLALKRYIWCWGWLLYLLVGLAWPVFAYLHYPDIADVWAHDYGKRWNENYIGEPWYYYAIHVPWNLFPWTIPAAIGLVAGIRRYRLERHRATLFVLCWAIVPPLMFSLFNGKHHHYMLSCIAPQAVLGAIGAVLFWQKIDRWPRWLRAPIVGGLLVSVPMAVIALIGLVSEPFAVIVLKYVRKIPGPGWVPWTVAIGGIGCVVASWYALSQRRGWVALGGFLAIVLVVHWAAFMHRTRYLDNYAEDLAFLRETLAIVPEEQPIFVLNEPHPLNAAWLLYYLGPRSQLLHNYTFLASDRFTTEEIYLVARQYDEANLRRVGEPTVILQSAKTRAAKVPQEHYTLFRLRFHPNLIRQPQPPVNSMEATGRKSGPELPILRE